MNKPNTLLVDWRNYGVVITQIIQEIVGASMIGIDIETEDSRRHAGLARAMKVGDDGHKAGNTKLLFDTNRTTVTGISIYCDGAENSYYFNLAHADIENRLDFNSHVRPLLDARTKECWWVAHNAPYELCMLFKSLGYDLGDRIICTMQLAVTAFNEDTYSVDDFLKPGLGGMSRLFPDINREFLTFQPGQELTKEQDELLYKVIAKESDAEHSYNGYVKSIAFGYGLKALSEKFLGYKQTTFKEVMGEKAHMGQLTGDEVAAYGADDAWVCMKLYHKLMEFVMQDNPAVIKTFFEQENPMVKVYAEVWGQGVRIDTASVLKHQGLERAALAKTLRTLKGHLRALLPFDAEPHEKLFKYDEWFTKGWQKYRKSIETFAWMPDCDDDFAQLHQVRSSISKQWAEEKGLPESKGINLTHYMVMRSVLLDLCHFSYQLSQGKTQSDSEARGKMRERLVKKNEETPDEKFKAKLGVLDCYKLMAESEQVIKLYVSKYLNITDPATSKVYPVLNSMLNSRRMAIAEPNLSQLPKNGRTSYVRSFFQADEDDHVIVTADWSGVELLLIGDASGDPEFAKAYGQRPAGDLHTPTAATLMDMSVEEFKKLPNAKALRRDLGKVGNFGYFFSGALGTVAQVVGWSSEKMWDAVEKFRDTYAVAEQWRVGTINEARVQGWVQLPDAHKRYRFESTPAWAQAMRQKAAAYGPVIEKFFEVAIRKIQTRSGNQAVNSKIQGSCASLAKRSILSIRSLPDFKALCARFMFPVHDELVFSVHRKDAVEFMDILWYQMCETHPSIVKTLKLDASVAVGRNYGAFDPEINPLGQIEVDEFSKVPGLMEDRVGKKLTREERQRVVDWLFEPAALRAVA